MASLSRTDIRYLKGIGENRAKLFRKLGINSIGDLIRYYPKSYENWGKTVDMCCVKANEVCCVKAMLASEISQIQSRKGLLIHKFKICDDTGYLEVVMFNRKYISKMIKPGEYYIFYGKVIRNFERLQMSSPKFKPIKFGTESIEPIYSQTEGLPSKIIQNEIKLALDLLPENMPDTLPLSIREKYNLCKLKYAIHNIHLPKNEKALETAKYRIVFEELLIFNLSISALKGNVFINKALNESDNTNAFIDYTESFYKLLPFSLTNAQNKVINECINDLKSNKYKMNRLIQGDVGCGKTVVSAAIIYSIIKNNMQVAFMVPTEILAKQQYTYFKKLFEGQNFNIELLTSSISKKKRNEIIENLKLGIINLLVGTHALISDDVQFFNLGLVITDEQHRFGVNQRNNLVKKGENPNVIVMSATPIPRTLALVLYCDMDISVINELPKGRKKVETYFFDSNDRSKVYNFIKKLLKNKGQGYIVCSLVEESESNMLFAKGYKQKLYSNGFSDYNIGLIHGKMNDNEKEEVMSKFISGDLDILISTTVIEVGVDVPNANFIIIENAERFGLSQLHQLRGRVGRGDKQSYCILISDSQSDSLKARMEIMCETNDGFKIADEDLKIRGPGDFFGTKQHGLLNLKLSSNLEDITCLKKVKNLTIEILSSDPDLSKYENRYIKAQVNKTIALSKRS